ncbi:ABC-type transport system permease [Planococcus antarcticus DSM 14505]|uniref:ABC transporter permease n=1 Tax=Planococcus antarcticus DSM 14505 TaxID=1185653 RepID=A0A1C7DCB2_9BACL|nr:TIGR02206 family membrane protein [Planococcus antarcticus]ANU09095.1 ABC transporter permease [Planococcus antarcticus DSM 14505]EIM08564.1 ABC-type transport system permease [Planococcus antarcticus DSM 14505]
METWFAATSTHSFNPFSLNHMLALVIAGAGIIVLVSAKERLREKKQLFQWLRWSLLSILFISEFSYHYWAITNGVWSFSGRMPLHLCGVASIAAMIGLLTMRPLWIQLSFYIGIVPAILALITPELPFDYQHFRFWKFFVHHTAIPWACLFLALCRPDAITLRSVFSVYTLLLAYAALIGFWVNPSIDSNYLYLMQRPTTTSPLDFFGDGIWYYINLCLTALLLFLGQYLLFRKFFKSP